MKPARERHTEFFKKNGIILILGLLCIIIPPLVCLGAEHNHRGLLGDWFGGTTAPWIGLFGAILIYISFREQVEANRLLKEEKNRVVFFKRYDEIIKRINETYEQIPEEKTLKWEESLVKKYRYVLSSIDSDVQSIVNFEDKADTVKGRVELKKNEDDSFSFKTLLRDKLMHYYEMKYEDYISNILKIIPPGDYSQSIITLLQRLQCDTSIVSLENRGKKEEAEEKRSELKSEIEEIEKKIAEYQVEDDSNYAYPVLMSIKNIIEVIVLKVPEFWGERDDDGFIYNI